MNIQQFLWDPQSGWKGDATPENTAVNSKSQWVLYFGSRTAIQDTIFYNTISKLYPNAQYMACTTAGTITKEDILDTSILCTAIEFKSTQVTLATYSITSLEDSFNAGKTLANHLDKQDLKGIFVLSNGLKVNGNELISGFREILGAAIPITGGLAGDGEKFEDTYVSCNGVTQSNLVGAIGFYGQHLSIDYGCASGWEAFGPNRIITKSKANILYELDHRPALELYKEYYGDVTNDMAKNVLLYPLSIKAPDEAEGVLRTVLGIENDLMIFGGDMPEGSSARLMRSTTKQLIDGASEAAQQIVHNDRTIPSKDPEHELSIIVSCIGRRILLGQRSYEEVDAVTQILGHECNISGFYSYGQISPVSPYGVCHFLNQTMNITRFSETDTDDK